MVYRFLLARRLRDAGFKLAASTLPGNGGGGVALPSRPLDGPLSFLDLRTEQQGGRPAPEVVVRGLERTQVGGRRQRGADEQEADVDSVREQVVRHGLEIMSTELFKYWVDEVLGR